MVGGNPNASHQNHQHLHVHASRHNEVFPKTRACNHKGITSWPHSVVRSRSRKCVSLFARESRASSPKGHFAFGITREFRPKDIPAVHLSSPSEMATDAVASQEIQTSGRGRGGRRLCARVMPGLRQRCERNTSFPNMLIDFFSSSFWRGGCWSELRAIFARKEN